MARADDTELIDTFEEFYRSYYRNEIAELAQKYPNEQKSLYVDWQDLYRFDSDLADDFRNKPAQLVEYAEEALRLYDLPVDVSLGQAHVRVTGLPEATGIRDIRADHRGNLIAVQGIVRKATDVRPKITNAAFECQRCGTLTRIPQEGGDFQEPHECQGCERQGPFRINYDQSEFIDAQKLRIQESPEGLRGGETPQNIDINVEDDITGEVTAGDHVRATGILKLEQQGNDREKSAMFDVYMEGLSVEIEDEEFEEMEITEEDKKEIIELSNQPDIYEQMVGAIAPSIYGYEKEKQAIIFQLFSGVTKFLPDDSRTRGDLHILLVGDPGTGKSALLQYIRNIAPRSVYTSGKGSSSAGLTAAAVRDDFGEGQQWTLEAGALVLADQGVAAIDELDKMRCVTGDTLVHTSNGITPIRELAQRAKHSGEIEQLDNGRTIRGIDTAVWSMTETGEIEERTVTAVHEYNAPDTLQEVKLESGETVTATADHPFFVLSDGERTTKAAAELEEGDWTCVPRSIPSRLTDGGVQPQSPPATENQVTLTPAHGSILGYIAGDGNVYYSHEDGSYGIRFTNAEEELLGDFERACRSAFPGSSPARYPSEQRDDGVKTVRLHGKEYANELLECGLNLETYDGKRVPEPVTAASREVKAAFIRALADAEGTVTERNVKIYSSSYELLLGTKMLLSEFGITSQIQTRTREDGRDLYVLAITADDSLSAFNQYIGFTLTRKQEALEEVCERTTGTRSILDVLPECGPMFADARESLRLYQSECGLVDSTYCNFENGDTNFSLRAAKTVLAEFEQRRATAADDLQSFTSSLTWGELETVKERYHVSQKEIAEGTSYKQGQISREWTKSKPLRSAVQNRLEEIVEGVSETPLDYLRNLIRGDVKWRRVEATEDIAAGENDRPDIRLKKNRLAGILDCAIEEAISEASSLLGSPPTATDWNDLRTELDRHRISYQELAERFDVAGSTVSRWFAQKVDGEDFDTVCSVALDLIEAKRTRVRNLRDEIEEREGPKVYDLTVEGTHNFVANGTIVHNSEDQSAMHEALEQQSYHPNSEVLLADGRRVEIGEFVDEQMASNPSAVEDGIDCEILPVDDVGVHTVDLESNTVEKTAVDRVSRHEAPEEFVRVEFSNGREVLVTPEHPMFVDDGTLGTVEASDIDEGAFVPAPRKLPNSARPVELADESQQGKEKAVTLPDSLDPDLAEILGLLTAEGHSDAGSAHGVGFSNQDEWLLDRFSQLMNSVFGMESTDTTDAAGTVTKRYVSTKLYRWFEENFPELMHTAREKRIPAAVLGASEEEIRRFLVGAFAGDGGVESEAMSVSTASEGLAEDYADALAKIGVASRIARMTDGEWAVEILAESAERFERKVRDGQTTDTQDEDAAKHESLRYYRVTNVETVSNEGEYKCEWVYDVTVEPTNTFVSQGVVLHNSISVSKAGINATLKSRCSLLGAANPTYGRFDQYEPIAEQIDLAPPLISRFDLIFIVTDQPNEEEDAELAEHILQTNYAGELNTHREEVSTSNYTEEEVERITDDVAPTIEPELLRKYIAYSRRNCYPTMTEEAKQAIQDYYVNLRARGTDDDAPVPVTARKLEALVRLAEASARVRLSDTVEESDAERAIDIAQYCMEEIGLDPETGELDADVVETGTTKSQRDRIKNIKQLIETIEDEYDEGAPVDVVIERAEEEGMETSKAEHEIDKLKQKGEVYEPQSGHLRTT